MRNNAKFHIFKKVTIKIWIGIFIFIVPINFSCRTKFKPQSQTKPQLHNLKMIVEVNGNIDVFKDEPHKFIIFNGSYLANSGVLVDLDNNTYYKIPISETERQYFRAVCRLRQYNANNNLSKLKIEAIGSTATYEVYTFSEGWTYKIRSRLIQSFSGELRLVKQNHNNNTNIIVQNFKNLPYSSNETKKTLEEEWSDNLGFSPDYKYMYYLNNEPDGRRFAYFIEL